MLPCQGLRRIIAENRKALLHIRFDIRMSRTPTSTSPPISTSFSQVCTITPFIFLVKLDDLSDPLSRKGHWIIIYPQCTLKVEDDDVSIFYYFLVGSHSCWFALFFPGNRHVLTCSR